METDFLNEKPVLLLTFITWMPLLGIAVVLSAPGIFPSHGGTYTFESILVPLAISSVATFVLAYLIATVLFFVGKHLTNRIDTDFLQLNKRVYAAFIPSFVWASYRIQSCISWAEGGKSCSITIFNILEGIGSLGSTETAIVKSIRALSGDLAMLLNIIMLSTLLALFLGNYGYSFYRGREFQQLISGVERYLPGSGRAKYLLVAVVALAFGTVLFGGDIAEKKSWEDSIRSDHRAALKSAESYTVDMETYIVPVDERSGEYLYGTITDDPMIEGHTTQFDRRHYEVNKKRDRRYYKVDIDHQSYLWRPDSVEKLTDRNYTYFGDSLTILSYQKVSSENYSERKKPAKLERSWELPFLIINEANYTKTGTKNTGGVSTNVYRASKEQLVDKNPPKILPNTIWSVLDERGVDKTVYKIEPTLYDFRGILVIDENGAVRRHSWNATLRIDRFNYTYRVKSRTRVTNIGNTTVKNPQWLERACPGICEQVQRPGINY